MADLKDMSDTKESSLKEAEIPPSSASSGEPITNVDAAWKFLDANRELDGIDVSDVELKRLRRKIDWHIVPVMFCCYTMQFLDKVILNVSCPTTFALRNPPPLGETGAALPRCLAPTLPSAMLTGHYSMPPSWVSTRSSSSRTMSSPTLRPSFSWPCSASRSPTVRPPPPAPSSRAQLARHETPRRNAC